MKRRAFLKSALVTAAGGGSYFYFPPEGRTESVLAQDTNAGVERSRSLLPAPVLMQSGLVTPKYFGALGYGDDSDAIEMAFRSGKIICLDQPYMIRRRIYADRNEHGFRSISAFGAGASSFITLGTPSAGIDLSIGVPELYNSCTVDLRSFRIVPAAVIPGSALRLSAAGGLGSTEATVFLSNVHVKPHNAESYANVGIDMHNMRIGAVENCSVEGYRKRLIPGSKGFRFTGDALTGVPVEVVFREIRSYFFETGWEAAGAWEGLKVLEADMIGCSVGYKAISNNANIGDSLVIENSQANVGYVGLWLEDVKNSRVVRNQLTGQNWGDSSDFYGAFIRSNTTSGQYMTIDGNLFNAQAIRSRRRVCTGLDIDGHEDPVSKLGSTVGANKFIGFNIGQSIGRNVRGAIFSNSDQFFDCGRDIRNSARRGANKISRPLTDY